MSYDHESYANDNNDAGDTDDKDDNNENQVPNVKKTYLDHVDVYEGDLEDMTHDDNNTTIDDNYDDTFHIANTKSKLRKVTSFLMNTNTGYNLLCMPDAVGLQQDAQLLINMSSMTEVDVTKKTHRFEKLQGIPCPICC